MTPRAARADRGACRSGGHGGRSAAGQVAQPGRLPACDDQVKQLGAGLWGDCDGRTVTSTSARGGDLGQDARAVLAAMDVPPDFRCHISAQTVTPHCIHRAAGDTDIYFVANGSPQAVDAECVSRVKGKRPEFWRPDTGRIEPVAVYDETADGTRMPIWFDPAGSVFVVFRPEEPRRRTMPLR